eukprot:4944393-Pyramimonas_sp.AAC.1
MSVGCTGMFVRLSIRSTLRSGTIPPASVNTCLHPATTSVCRDCVRPPNPEAKSANPCGSGPSHTTAIPKRRRTAHNTSALVNVIISQIGHTRSHVAEWGPVAEFRRALLVDAAFTRVDGRAKLR